MYRLNAAVPCQSANEHPPLYLQEAEERATLDDIKAITLKRSDLEAWHNEPFFEEDVRGCVLRVVNQQAPAVNGQAQYIMCRIGDIVTRNSYA